MNKLSRIIRISSEAIVLSTILASSSLCAGEMASQKWVNTRIAQQETNTQAFVNERISASEAGTDAKISATESRINASIDEKVSLERFRAESAEGENANAITEERSRAIAAETANESEIHAETNRAMSAENVINVRLGSVEGYVGQIQTDVSSIKSKIPLEASSVNKLADKAFVNDVVRLYASTFRGSFATWMEVPSNGSSYHGGFPQKNDYITIQEAAEYGISYSGTWLFRYSADEWSSAGKNGWCPEYKISTTTMTPEQLAAINSGINIAKVLQIGSNTTAIAESRNYTISAIAQQETNTQEVVNEKISIASSNIMENVSSLITTTIQTSSNVVVSAGRIVFTIKK